MPVFAEDITLAKDILQTFYAQVMTPENSYGLGDIAIHWSNRCRSIARDLSSEDLSLPGTVRGVAATLVGLGQCQEMGQRFFWEYTKQHQRYDLTMLFLKALDDVSTNHLVLVMHAEGEGQARVDKSGHMLFNISASVTLEAWLARQSEEAVLIDPLLNVVCPVKNLDDGFKEYCASHSLTHVMGAHEMTRDRFEFSADQFSEMQRQCEQMADCVQQKVYIELLNSVNPWFGVESVWETHKKQPHLVLKAGLGEVTQLKEKLLTYGFPADRLIIKANTQGSQFLFIKNGASHRFQISVPFIRVYQRAYQVDYALSLLNRVCGAALCPERWQYNQDNQYFYLHDRAEGNLSTVHYYLQKAGIDQAKLTLVVGDHPPYLKLAVTSLSENIRALNEAVKALPAVLEKIQQHLEKRRGECQGVPGGAAAEATVFSLAKPGRP